MKWVKSHHKNIEVMRVGIIKFYAIKEKWRIVVIVTSSGTFFIVGTWYKIKK